MGTKKGQVRKTARRAYTLRRPKPKTTRTQTEIMLLGRGYYNDSPKLVKKIFNFRKM